MTHRFSRPFQLAATLLLALLPATTIRAQDAANTSAVFKVKTRIVVLDIVVTDKKGNVVTGLKQDDFKVYEDKQPQTILSFEPPSAHVMPASPNGQAIVNSTADLPKIGDAPVTIIVLDELNTSFEEMSSARQELAQYLMKQPAVLKQPTALLVVNSTKSVLLHDYTQSRADIVKVLKAHMPQYPWKSEDVGSGMEIGKNGAGAVERIAQTMSAVIQIANATSGTPGRKNVIWVGVNAPGVSLLGADESVKKAMEGGTKRLTQKLLDARITMYYINPTRNDSSIVSVTVPQNNPDVATFVDTDPFGSAVDFNKFGPATGGQIFYSRNDISQEIATAIDNGATYYTLTYSPSNKSENAAKYRNIAVRLTNPDLLATTREGYYPEQTNADNSVNDPTLPATQRQKLLELDLSTAATSTLPYNGLTVTAQKTSDPKLWQVSVPAKELSWTTQAGGEQKAEVTAMSVAYDGNTKSINILAHAARELTSIHNSGDAASGAVTFQVPVELPDGTKRLRFILRDAVSGHLGTADAKP
jgi:VWFA-related protein